MLVLPEADAVAAAGRRVQRPPELWAAVDLTERRRLLLTVLDAVYVDAREAMAVVSIRPEAAFVDLLGVGCATLQMASLDSIQSGEP